MPLRRHRESVPDALPQPAALDLTPAAMAALLGRSPGADWAGEFVSEETALMLSGIWRGALTIANAIGSLPLKTYRTTADDERERVGSFFDNPAGPNSLVPFEWKQTNALHLVLQGEAPMLHVKNEGGQLVGLKPIHPLHLSMDYAPAEESGEGRTYPDGVIYKVTVRAESGTGTEQKKLSSKDITVVRGPCTKGLRGMSFLSFGRNSLGTSLAGEKAAGKAFRNGMMTAGVLVPGKDENLSITDVETIRDDLDNSLFGVDNAGRVPIVNRVLEFQPWAMTLEDAQFLESRAFQLEEACRWVGVPPHLIYDLSKSTSWGTGIAEQNKNLSQFVLIGHTMPMEQRCSLLLAAPRFVEFDYAGLEAGSAKDVSGLLLSEVNGGIRTPNEARRILNLPPLDGGDVLRVPSGIMLTPVTAGPANAPLPTEETT